MMRPERLMVCSNGCEMAFDGYAWWHAVTCPLVPLRPLGTSGIVDSMDQQERKVWRAMP